MCFALWTAGYWADFIDPTTGAAVSNSVFTVPVLYCLKAYTYSMNEAYVSLIFFDRKMLY